MPRRVRVSLIGCGRVAHDHLRAIQNSAAAELISVVDKDQEKALRCAQEYGAKRSPCDYHEVLEDVEVDAVVISAPTHLHHRMTLEALTAGKHVLCEKPMSETAAQADEMVRQAAQRGVVLMVGQVMRFMPIFSEAKRLVAEGRLGRPLHALERRFCYRTEAFPWWAETQGFLIAHHGSHSIDLFMWLLDSSAVRVYADASSHLPSYPGEDDFGLQMVLRNEAVVSLHHSFLSRYLVHDMVIIGTAGTMRVECFTTLSFNEEEIFNRDQPEVWTAGFAQQTQEYITAISEGREPASSGKEVLPTMRVIDAARRSAEEHRAIEIK